MGVYYPQAAITLRVRWETFGDENDPLLSKQTVIRVNPRQLTVNINDYTEADKFSCEIDYKNFPFDPRSLRSIGVTIHVQDMGSLFDRDGNRTRLEPSQDEILFLGFVDEETIRFDDSSRTVKFSGRDFTSLLVDQPYFTQSQKGFEQEGRAKGPLLLRRPVDLIISDLLSELPQTQDIEVVNRTGEDLPVLAKDAKDHEKTSGQRNTKKKESYWDAIQSLARSVGLIAYIELDKLIITKPRALYDATQAKQFIFGKNLKKLSYKRKVGRVQEFNVAVRAFDFDNKQMILVKIPEQASDAFARRIGVLQQEVKLTKLDTRGKEVEAEPAPYLSFLVPNVKSFEQLQAIGESVFEELGRQQLEGEMETKDMIVSFGTEQNPVEFDVTKLRIGTPLRIEIDDERDLKKIRRLESNEARTNYLIQRGYRNDVARALAVALGRFNPIFYTKAVEFQFDSENGFSTRVDFLNFIEIPASLKG